MAGELLCPGVLVYKMVTMGGFKINPDFCFRKESQAAMEVTE